MTDNLVERLQVAHDDPMWADHVEMPKRFIAEILAALRAATALGAGEPGVKALVWLDHGPDAFPARTWSAQTPFGFYEIEEESASDSPRYRLEWHSHSFIIDEDSLEAAKAAAQADYERRIRSALVAPPAPAVTEGMRFTDAMVERAVEASYDKIEIDFDGDDAYIRADSYETAVRAAITAALSAPPAPGVDAGTVEMCAKVADDHSFAMDIDWWLNATKKEVSAEACRSTARAIRALLPKDESK